MRVVTHHTHMVVVLGKLSDDEMLSEVGVLILINKDILKSLLILLEYVGVVAKQNVGIYQQVVEVHCSGNLAAVAISLVNLGGERPLEPGVLVKQLAVALVVRRHDERIFHH